MKKIDTGTEELLCDIHQRVAVVTLNKPHKKNALGDILTPALRALLPVLEERADVGCVMLTGAGEAFCSGGDVSAKWVAAQTRRSLHPARCPAWRRALPISPGSSRRLPAGSII